jgi:hypothetical protein
MFVSEPRWTPKNQGNLGEGSAIAWFTQQGAIVWRSVFEHPDVDLIAEFDYRLERVQVKTSSCWIRDRWSVAVCTRGGNQSWNGIVKRLDATRCDSLFIHVGDGRRWYMPVEASEGRTSLQVGGPKYSQYEISRGEPLPSRPSRSRKAGHR